MTAALLTLDRLLGFPVLAKSLKGAEKAAATDTQVLILGEAGSGRSTVARAFHAAGPRAAGPLVEMDSGAIPSTLFESELFGYRAGAFTGAEGGGEGRLVRAAGGSLILDHVEELPLAVQPKLLRLLAEGKYAPLGGREVKADVRFLAIGAENMEQRMRSGAFRSDLYYRLEVLAFLVPPLRERRADLPAVLDAVLVDLGERFGRPGAVLAPTARAWMLQHPWPGNLRQLRNVLERGLILSGEGPIDPPQPKNISEEVPLTLLAVEQAHILHALAYTRGNQSRAAKLLGISRKALWEKRKRYGMK